MSTAHTDEDIDYVIQGIKDSVGELGEGGFLPDEFSAGKDTTDEALGYKIQAVNDSVKFGISTNEYAP